MVILVIKVYYDGEDDDGGHCRCEVLRRVVGTKGSLHCWFYSFRCVIKFR